MNFQADLEFKKLGVMGITVVASSGDSGAPGTGSLPLNPGYPSASPYVVVPMVHRVANRVVRGVVAHLTCGYGGSYVTCVGATEFQQGTCSTDKATLPAVCTGQGFTCCSTGTEVPADEPAGGYASGGGFSLYEPRPAYQDAAVEQYATPMCGDSTGCKALSMSMLLSAGTSAMPQFPSLLPARSTQATEPTRMLQRWATTSWCTKVVHGN